MKRVIQSSFIALAVTFSAGAFAQIPVTDGASIAQNIANHVEDVAKFVQQIEQLKLQVEQQKQQFEALTGARNLGDIFNDPRFRQYLPADWQKVYDSVKSGGYAGLTGTAKSIFDQNHIYDACSSIQDNDQKSVCEQQATKPALDQGMATDAYNTATDRLNQIEQLTQQINATQDPKAIAELQGRIATEQAAIQNEQTKLQLYQMVADAQDKIQEQRQNEINARTWAARGGISATAPTFGH